MVRLRRTGGQAGEMSELAACRVLGVDPTRVRYQATRADDGVLRERLKTLIQQRRQFGYRGLHVLCKREGHAVNNERRPHAGLGWMTPRA